MHDRQDSGVDLVRAWCHALVLVAKGATIVSIDMFDSIMLVSEGE